MAHNIIEMEVDYVLKRNGDLEETSFDKITKRLKTLSLLNKKLNINPTKIAKQICSQLYNKISTDKIDILASEICAAMSMDHPDYIELASRIIISQLHKNSSPSFSETIRILYENKDNSNNNSPLIDKELFDIVEKHKTKLNSYIKYKKDFYFDYFGLKTLLKSYLFKINGKIIERPQHMYMRVALGIHGSNIKEVLKTYDYMSDGLFIHATPTLFNSGTPRPQMSSCFLLAMKDDSIDGIYTTIKDCASISKWSGGIGLHVSNIRSKGSLIRGTNGISQGLVPFLRVVNNTARYVDQGGGKRNGSIAIYIEPWHSDIFDVLLLKKNHGAEEERARDLFYGLWIPDLFMKRVENNEKWTLMCPDECPGLTECYGEEFEKLYIKYENENKGKKTIEASKLWWAIVESQIETGTPYLCYKDACNYKSNQKNLGVIKSSNLCTEIIEYSSPDEYAVCNLASIGLSKYVINKSSEYEILKKKSEIKSIKIYSISNCKYCILAKNLLNTYNVEYEIIDLDEKGKKTFVKSQNTICVDDQCKIIDENDENYVKTFPQIFVNDERIGGFNELYNFLKPKQEFDFNLLAKVTKIVTRNLNQIIDKNYYPVPETQKSNLLHRPMGIGVQGLADVFAKLHISFDSEDAAIINKKIFEVIYYNALETSMEISKKREKTLSFIKKYKSIKEPTEDELNEYNKIKDITYLESEINREKYLGSYSSFEGSPASKGILQFDLWNAEPSREMKGKWNKLKKDIQKYGLRNSLFLAPMPTASTSQILGNNECIEPFTSNLYLRRVLAGEYIVINKYLIRILIDLGIWNTDLKNSIIKNYGSIQNIDNIPSSIKPIFKTVWEIGNKTLIKLAADRGVFIDQSQSLNLFMAEPTFKKLTSMHFFAWKKGLKTGQYYLRTKPISNAQQFTIEPEKECLSCSA